MRRTISLSALTVTLIASTIGPAASTEALLNQPDQQANADTIELVAGSIQAHIDTSTPSVTGRYILQFGGPLTSATLDRLSGSGAGMVGYLPDYAFVVELRGIPANRLTTMPGVIGFFAYEPE